MMKVTGFKKDQTRNVDGKPLKGFVITSGAAELAFIHADFHTRIESLLRQYTSAGTYTACELMRALLNAEDFNSPIYDRIFRVYYVGEFDPSYGPVLRKLAETDA